MTDLELAKYKQKCDIEKYELGLLDNVTNEFNVLEKFDRTSGFKTFDGAPCRN